MNYQGAKDFILDKLSRELSPKLYYHGLHHTLDVLEITIELCNLLDVNAYETTLLKTAVLFHDAGFTEASTNHEEIGCRIVRAELPRFDYRPDEIERICGMIMATKIPQNPQNRLEEIICDADLDYLGRSDFYEIGDTLFQELRAFDVLDSPEEWNRIQVRFLENHGFFTSVNLKRRRPEKLLHLENLRAVVATY